jgi:hypothetical protein
MWRAGPGSADVSSAVLEWPQATPFKPPTRINGFVSADEDVSAPGATVPSFPLSAFNFQLSAFLSTSTFPGGFRMRVL